MEPQVEPFVGTIGTHDGTFHADEVTAYSLLKLLPPIKNNHKLIRTRNQEELNKCDILIDIGGVFDSEKGRFDHHQPSFSEVFDSNHKTKLSSAGLIYKYFGKEILARIIMELSESEGISEGLETAISSIPTIHNYLYNNFIEQIDGIDNGIEPIEGGWKNYNITTTLGQRVSRLNLNWYEEYSKEKEDEAFYKAVELVTLEFKDAVKDCVKSWLPARKILEEAFADSFSREQDKYPLEILELKKWCPWNGHLFNIENEKEMKGIVKYVLYPDDSSYTSWRVTCVPIAPSLFVNRLPLPEEWRGLKGDELSNKTDIEGCTFVHSSGFTGGNKTLEGAWKMAIKSIELGCEKYNRIKYLRASINPSEYKWTNLSSEE